MLRKDQERGEVIPFRMPRKSKDPEEEISPPKRVLKVFGISPTEDDFYRFWFSGVVSRLPGVASDYYDEILLSIPQVARRQALETLQTMYMNDDSPVKFSFVSDGEKLKRIIGVTRSEDDDGMYVMRAKVIGSGKTQKISEVRFLFLADLPVVAPKPPGKVISLEQHKTRRSQQVL